MYIVWDYGFIACCSVTASVFGCWPRSAAMTMRVDWVVGLSVCLCLCWTVRWSLSMQFTVQFVKKTYAHPVPVILIILDNCRVVRLYALRKILATRLRGLQPLREFTQLICLITGPPTHSVGARLVMLSGVCRRGLSSSVTLHGEPV